MEAKDSAKSGVLAKGQKVDKIKGKLDQAKEVYESTKGSLWAAFDWYHRAGGLLAAQEAETLREVRSSSCEISSFF